jgi:hypothetical protein
LRSCLLISANREFYFWLKRLSEYPSFQASVALNDRLVREQYDIELALRFIILRRLPEQRLSEIRNLGEFLDNESLRLASDGTLDREAEEDAFRNTFDLLAISDGEDALRKYNAEKGRFQGAFLNTSFEAIAMGLGYNVEYYTSRPEQVNPTERAKQFWSDPLFGKGFATGMSTDARLARTIPRGRRLFAPS